MAYRKIKTITRPHGIEVIVSKGLHNYRICVVGEPDDDDFIPGRKEAFDEAERRANTLYEEKVRAIAKSIPADTVRELENIAYAVWQQIGSDMISACRECGEECTNESAIETCFDADRPLTLLGEAEEAVCDAAFEKYGFDACCLVVCRRLHIV